MQTKLPVHLIKPRFLQEVPRAEYSAAPALKGNDEKSRLSFISLLRKGQPKKNTPSNAAPKEIEFNCAAWLHSNRELNQPVSLMLHIKDAKEEYLVLVDESHTDGTQNVMLSGTVTIKPKGAIEFIRACCSGIPAEHHVHIEELHVKGDVRHAESNMKLAANG